MQSENETHDKESTKLEISFPGSSEDHRLQLVAINGSIFAIVHSPLESDGPIHLHCDKWSLILLAPIKSKTNIEISAINVICLNEISSLEGTINIHATNRLISFTPLKATCKTPSHNTFVFDQDPGALLHQYRTFSNVVTSARSNDYSAAQQNFLMSLCVLADKMAGKEASLTLNSVLDIWNISSLKNNHP